MEKLNLSESALWQAVAERDRHYDGVFFFGVTTTRIFCRPQCPSRRPKRENTLFFFSAQTAAQAGFRACKRCRPDQAQPVDPAHWPVLAACRYIEACDDHVPSLAEVAHHVGLSASHFQRIFKQTLGVSPKDYADAHRQQRLKSALQNGSDVTGALYEAGYGSSSRLYEQSDRILGMTPTAYKEAGQGQEIHYAVGQCPLGWLLLAATSKGICAVRLGDSQARLVQELYQEFSQAHILESGSFVAEWIQLLIDYLAERLPWPELPVDVQATAFQRRVWNELRTIPAGETKTYSDIAAALGQPQATRAVARACAANPVALVVPCHRIVPKAGGSGGYRWGPERKQWLLALEARTAPAPR